MWSAELWKGSHAPSTKKIRLIPRNDVDGLAQYRNRVCFSNHATIVIILIVVVVLLNIAIVL